MHSTMPEAADPGGRFVWSGPWCQQEVPLANLVPKLNYDVIVKRSEDQWAEGFVVEVVEQSSLKKHGQVLVEFQEHGMRKRKIFQTGTGDIRVTRIPQMHSTMPEPAYPRGNTNEAASEGHQRSPTSEAEFSTAK